MVKPTDGSTVFVVGVKRDVRCCVVVDSKKWGEGFLTVSDEDGREFITETHRCFASEASAISVKRKPPLAGQRMMKMAQYNVIRYNDGKCIGSANLTDQQHKHYLAMSQQPEGIIRLGALPHDYYDLDEDCQDESGDTVVYID